MTAAGQRRDRGVALRSGRGAGRRKDVVQNIAGVAVPAVPDAAVIGEADDETAASERRHLRVVEGGPEGVEVELAAERRAGR
jgi:hypothetical protein